MRKLIAQCQSGHTSNDDRPSTPIRRHRVLDQHGTPGVKDLIQRYEQRESVASLAQDLDVPVRCVRKVLSDQGGQNLRRDGQTLTPELAQLATHLYCAEAVSPADVAKEMNIKIHTVGCSPRTRFGCVEDTTLDDPGRRKCSAKHTAV